MLLNKKSVVAIMNKRVLITEQLVGKRTKMTIQGNGNVIDVTDSNGDLVPSASGDGTVFQKKIFNAKANSAIAMANPRNKQLFQEGIAAEKAGNLQLAHEKYNAFLNAVQFSFSIPLPSAKADVLGDGVEIGARIEKVTTDNGSLLTVQDASSISVVELAVATTTTFDISAFEEEDKAPVETPEQAKARIKAEKAAAKARL